MIFHLGSHLPEVLAPVAHTGWMGVDLFFVLSGYLIGRQWMQRPGLREFYRRRAYRILPAYLLVVLLYFAWPLWRERPGISPLWQFLTFTENLFVDYGRNQAFSHVWSLCIEEHFYLLMPIALLGLTRRASLKKSAGMVVAIVLFGIAARTWVLLHTLRPLPVDGDWDTLYIERIYYPTYARLDGLLMGVVLAAVEIFRPVWWRAAMRRGHLLTAAGAALTGLAIWMFWRRFVSDMGVEAWSITVGFPILSLGLGLLVASAMSEDGLLARVRVPGAKTVAMLAFSLYLTHKEIVHLDRIWMPGLTDARTWWGAGMIAGTCGAAAALMYYGVERPFLMLRDRRVRGRLDEVALADPAL